MKVFLGAHGVKDCSRSTVVKSSLDKSAYLWETIGTLMYVAQAPSLSRVRLFVTP